MKAEQLVEYAKNALADHWGYIWGTSGEMWTAAKQAALEKTTDADRANSRKYGSQWIGHFVTDCSGLIYRCCKQHGVPMVHGSNTMYLSYCSSKGKLVSGKREDGKALLPGTAVFTYNSNTGKYGHVGVYVGDGLVIEAMGAKNGVTTSKISKWGFWGELKGVDYSESKPAEETPVSEITTPGIPARPTLRRGAKGDVVALLQEILVNQGYDVGKTGVDGDYGKATEAAVKKFQKDHGLTVDGICGNNTWYALYGKVKGWTVTIPGLSKEAAEGLVKQYPEATMREGV